ncbi:Tol-Pal system beta propeller repeat protein TolB [Uliginosibacterium gangwonense]|uniref:Tol-Pal system beta propeller repeat protein TolB n=1 Tax=Uliginosibacterium gangwonense TaxID=392736 RepID=UPI000378E2F8|nr:Tol-Pal system beta propeller repeat protein TolB [Uliginosibacterium gangwonense]
MLRRKFLLGLLSLIASSACFAQLTIEISGAGANRLPIAVASFAGENKLPAAISEVIQFDLNRSGVFKLIDTAGVAAPEVPSPDFSQWRGRGADALVLGTVNSLADGRMEVRFRLFDTTKQSQLEGQAITFRTETARRTGHQIADIIYQRLTGLPGIFSTRIAYIERQGKRYRLMVDDSDGQNPQAALISGEPIISPAWSPDGSRIAYVSFEKKKPIVYVRPLGSSMPFVLANFKGSNSAPAWSPDGRKLAVTLTKDGLSQLYLLNADGSGLRRLTTSAGIDTEPVFSPDGASIYFTSDRGGSPQIYKIPAEGGNAQRVTFEGSYNVSPRISPDGKTLAYIARNNGMFQVTVQDLATQQTQILTDSAKDESPSFAPDGRTILYATEVGGRGVLATVSIDGRVRQRLSSAQVGDVREPAWGPLAK